MQSIVAIVCLSVALNYLILWAFLKIGDWQWTQFLEQRARRAISQKSIPHTQQPVINVNVDTGAISQAMILRMKILIEQQTETLSNVLRESLENREITVVNEPVSVPIETGGTVGKSLDERIRVYYVKHPGTSVRNVAKALKCSPSKVQR
jgi:hypothetical protein